ncbi:hypothetical protein MTO96_029538 [Rhipicephalus appendiculatus]
MPAKTANQLNELINSFLWDGKPALVRRNLLQLAVSEGGRLGLPHGLTSSKVLALKTARSLFEVGDYFGRGLLLYWSGATNGWLDAGRHARPLAESPSPFFRAASETMRMLGKEAPSCDGDADPPARTRRSPYAEPVERRGQAESQEREARDGNTRPQAHHERSTTSSGKMHGRCRLRGRY